jgi:hypothetical protein
MKYKLGECIYSHYVMNGELASRLGNQTVFSSRLVNTVASNIDVSLYRGLSLSYRNSLNRSLIRASSLDPR